MLCDDREQQFITYNKGTNFSFLFYYSLFYLGYYLVSFDSFFPIVRDESLLIMLYVHSYCFSFRENF